MKKTTLFIALIAITLSGCNNKKTEIAENTEIKNEEVKTKTPGFTEIDLSSNGMKLTMSVPDSVKDKLKLFKVSDIQINGEVGEYGFTVFSAQNIDESENLDAIIKEHLDDRKADITKDANNKFKRYIADEAKGIFWESEDHGTEFHFCVMVPLGKTAYYEVVSNGAMDSEAAQKAIFNYVKTLKAKDGV